MHAQSRFANHLALMVFVFHIQQERGCLLHYLFILLCVVDFSRPIELFINILKGGRNHGFVPFLGKLSNKSSLACHVPEPTLKIRCNFLAPPLSTSQTLREF